MAENKKQLPAPKTETKSLTLVEQMEKELSEITSANFYEVPARGGGKRMEPDAKALQYYANKAGGIATKVLESSVNMTQATAKVQAWLKIDPAMVKEDVVTIVFEMEFQSYVWDYVSKGCKRHQNGCPIKKTSEGKAIIQDGIPVLDDIIDIMELKKLMNRKMRFAERECITKAEKRLHTKLLSMEFRDPEEIESEAKDVALLSDNAPLPSGGAAQPAQEPKKEAAKATEFIPQGKTAAPAAKPAEKATEKKPEAAKPAAAPTTTAPAAAVIGPPKAQIPTEKEMNEKARQEAVKAPEQASPAAPKKRSEIVSELAVKIGCTNANIMAFMARTLNCTDPSGLGSKPKAELDAVIAGVGQCFNRYGAVPTCLFIKGEKSPDEALDQNAEIGEHFLLIYAQEMNKSKEVK